MKKMKLFCTLLLCIGLLIPQAFAKDVWELAQSEAYKEKTGGMLGRGLLNAATSPVDIFVQTVKKTESGPPLLGTLTGMAGGLGCTALRASSGIVDVALFWVPGFNGFPVSRSYENCLEEASEEPAQAPMSFVTPTPTPSPTPMTVVSEPMVQKPVVTVVDSEPSPTPRKRVVRKHNPYDYVKK